MELLYKLDLIPLCTMELAIGEIFQIGRGLYGTRGIGEIVRGRLEGERLRADQLGRAAADWGLVSDDGFVRGDIRMAWKTDDGAQLYMAYVTYLDVGGHAYATPEFETGDARYAWLNRTRLVGKGTFDPEAKRVRYQLFELR
jgi:hypothetical protein